MPHLDVMARRCFQEEAWQQSPRIHGMVSAYIVVAILVVFHLAVFPLSWWWGAVIMSMLLMKPMVFLAVWWEDQLTNLFSAIIAAFSTPSHVRRRLRAYRLRDPATVIGVCTFVVQEYRNQIDSERARAIGQDSEWALKRGKISRAADGALAAVAYWNDRSRAEPGSEAVKEQLEAASGLSRKLTSALASLDQHAEAVRRTLAECRDKVSTMQLRIRDVQQVRQLDGLPVGAGDGRALADTSVNAIIEDLIGETEEVGAALAGLSTLEVAVPSEVVSDNIEHLADQVAEESGRAKEVIAGLSITAKDEAKDSTTPQSASPDMPYEADRSAVETPEAPLKREVRPVEPAPEREDRITELRRQRIRSEADYRRRNQEIQEGFERREREIQKESLQRRQEILEQSLQRRQGIHAKHELDPPPTSLNPERESIASLDPTPDDPPQTPAPSRSTSSQTPARMSETEEEKQMKQLVGMLRRMADVQDRRAHDLRYRDEFNWEADDREELARKMTELADDIEMFQRLSNRMKDMEGGNPGT